MDAWYITAALATGFLGSMHCLAMCGPIAFALPIGGLSTSKKIGVVALYHLARISAYGVLGLILGIVGRSIFVAVGQMTLSVLAGVLLLIVLVPAGWLPQSGLGRLTLHLKQAFSRNLLQKNWYNFVYSGFLNGLLPCGLVYIALATALIRATPYASSLTMMAFGLGTLPAMLLVHVLGGYVPVPQRLMLQKISPYLTVCIGLLLVIRGLNLGIPYVSPAVSDGNKMECCKKTSTRSKGAILIK